MKVRLISTTQPRIDENGDACLCGDHAMTAEQLIVYCARVSSPQNQTNHDTAQRLIRYCLRHQHWSIFDMVDMTVEVETSRAMSAQIVRHWSFEGIEVVPGFRFQELSQRYATVTDVLDFERYRARRQASTNKQSSVDDLPDDVIKWFDLAQEKMTEFATSLYRDALSRGVARECARFLLPMSVGTKFYMKGSVRSWITYLRLRRQTNTQAEHRAITLAIEKVFREHFPIIAAAALDEPTAEQELHDLAVEAAKHEQLRDRALGALRRWFPAQAKAIEDVIAAVRDNK